MKIISESWSRFAFHAGSSHPPNQLWLAYVPVNYLYIRVSLTLTIWVDLAGLEAGRGEGSVAYISNSSATA
jgi:hypothetical protein